MAGRFDDDEQDKPLDPAVEKVRRKLVRFVAINLGLLFVALMAVVAAIVYRANRGPEAPPAQVSELPAPSDGVVLEGRIDLARGARVLGHSLSGTAISVLSELPDGSREIVVYDIAAGRVSARVGIASAP